MYSVKTRMLVQAYCDAFPELVKMLTICAARDGGEKEMVFDAATLFPGKNSMQRVQAVAAWVGSSEVASLPLVPLDAEVLPKSTVYMLGFEALVARDLQLQLSALSGKPATVLVPRSCIMSARSGATQLPKEAVRTSRLRCGDRVVSWKSTGSVPFGARGTIVGIRGDDVAEVVFDEPFIGGGTLNGRCMANRGKAVTDDSLLLIKPGDENGWYLKNYVKVRAEGVNRYGSPDQMSSSEDYTRKQLTARFVQAGRSYAQASKEPAVRGNDVMEMRSGTSYSSMQGAIETQWNVGEVQNVRTASNPAHGARSGKAGGLDYYPSPSKLPLPKFLGQPVSQGRAHRGRNSRKSFRGRALRSDSKEVQTVTRGMGALHVGAEEEGSGERRGVGGGLQAVNKGPQRTPNGYTTGRAPITSRRTGRNSRQRGGARGGASSRRTSYERTSQAAVASGAGERGKETVGLKQTITQQHQKVVSGRKGKSGTSRNIRGAALGSGIVAENGITEGNGDGSVVAIGSSSETTGIVSDDPVALWESLQK